MPKVTVSIEYFSAEKGTITNVATPTGNNINNPALTNEYEGAVPFVFGASRLGYGDTFWDTTKKYDGFFSGVLTSSSGTSDITITLTGSNIKHFVINFDKVAKQWAQTIIVNGVTYTNDSVLFVWSGESASSHTIRITKWNKPLYPVRITSILLYLSVEYKDDALKEVIVGSQSVSDNLQPEYGVLSQYGSLLIIDHDNRIANFARQRLLKSNLSIKFYLNSTLIGDLTSEKWNYAYGSNRVRVELQDELQRWSKIKFTGYNLEKNISALTVFNRLNTLSGNIVTLASGLSSWLGNITIGYFFMEKGTLLSAWEKLCAIAQLRIYKQSNGSVVAVRYQ